MFCVFPCRPLSHSPGPPLAPPAVPGGRPPGAALGDFWAPSAGPPPLRPVTSLAPSPRPQNEDRASAGMWLLPEAPGPHVWRILQGSPGVGSHLPLASRNQGVPRGPGTVTRGTSSLPRCCHSACSLRLEATRPHLFCQALPCGKLAALSPELALSSYPIDAADGADTSGGPSDRSVSQEAHTPEPGTLGGEPSIGPHLPTRPWSCWGARRQGLAGGCCLGVWEGSAAPSSPALPHSLFPS